MSAADTGMEPVMNPRTQWLLLLISMLALGLVLALDAWQEYQSVRGNEVARLTRQTEIVEKNLSHDLQKSHDALIILAREAKIAFQARPGVRLDLKLERFVSVANSLRTVTILNADGIVVDSNRPELIGRSFIDSERYKTVRNSNDPAMLYVFPPYVTPLGNFAMALGVAISDGKGGFGGYIVAVLDPQYFSTLLSSLVYTSDVRLGVVHQNGLVVYRVPDEERIVGQDVSKDASAVFPKHIAENRPHTFFEARTAASPSIRYTSFRRVRPATAVADNALHVFVSRNRSAIFAVWRNNLYRNVALFLLVGSVAIAGLCVYQKRRRTERRMELILQAERARAEAEVRELNEKLEVKVIERTAALSKANAELGYLSHHDILTGLNNRLSANTYLRSEFLRMKRSGNVYGVLMLDIDHFKNINDMFGHSAGDEVLHCVANAVKAGVRESDFVARYGGEEFLVVLPDADGPGAQLAAEKIRAAVESAECRESCPVTVSVGVALSTPDDPDEDVAVRLADARLYSAKTAGRNRVVADGVGSTAGSVQ